MSDEPWEIQTCIAGPSEGSHRWHCFGCGANGPAEVDGRAVKRQAAEHLAECEASP